MNVVTIMTHDVGKTTFTINDAAAASANVLWSSKSSGKYFSSGTLTGFTVAATAGFLNFAPQLHTTATQFTVPVAGTYMISATMSSPSGTQNDYLQIYVNNVAGARVVQTWSFIQFSGFITLVLKVGDTIRFYGAPNDIIFPVPYFIKQI